ncbi:MAG: hypothetical protein H7146_09500 [Burkholderiaceae bacterium]|nr:hypothetical protein [Microbacteriaceae bacterium]
MASKSVAYLSYPDEDTAIAWLAAIGFTTVTRQDGDAGAVRHAELRLGAAVVMVASDDRDYVIASLVGQSTGAGILCRLEIRRFRRCAVELPPPP